jgi:ectoine hydroxylase-related dioxygenase (phytanoyl-CoA dioxygenase family)
MHRWDEMSMNWMVDPRIRDVMTGLLDREPLAVQTMIYFKPAGARGQALHQDNYYLRVQPGGGVAGSVSWDLHEHAPACSRSYKTGT